MVKGAGNIQKPELIATKSFDIGIIVLATFPFSGRSKDQFKTLVDQIISQAFEFIRNG